MKLRNKKTGEVVERISIVTLSERRTSCSSSLVEAEEFRSIGQLNEDWEDYKPTEPLIDDKDIRNRLRKWMEAIGISLDTHLTGVQSGAYGLIIECGDNRIAFCYYKKLLSRKKTGLATMRELIGEEEECES